MQEREKNRKKTKKRLYCLMGNNIINIINKKINRLEIKK